MPIMASIHRQSGKPHWFASFAIYNPETNRWRRVFRSTKTRDKKQALEIMRAWDKAARKARIGKLSIDAARAIIAEGVSDIFMEANAASLPSASIKAWCETWLEGKKIEVEESTYDRYKHVVERFTDFLGDAQSKRDLLTLQSSDLARFRNRESKELAVATANLNLSVLRICLGEAVRQGLLTVNPAVRVKPLKSSDESKRRAFTMDEIQRILKACADDVEWRGLILFGLYLGQRLGDLARLTWRAVNLETNEVAFTAKKTGRRIVLPLLQPLVDYLSALPANDDPNAYIFPHSATVRYTASLSNRFREILVEAGLVEPRPWERNSKPTGSRSSARETSEISFHSLRHSAVTMLKAAGVSDFMAMQIIGHESSAISRQYSHLSVDDLRRAMERLPDVSATTKAPPAKRGTKR
jgi:integrase